MTNQDIARKLRDHATALARGGDNLYRVRAFRRAAIVVMGLNVEVAAIDRRALERVPGIGKSLAQTIVGFAI